ncbi:hypothetical protein JXB27_04235 [Candidatus Woesearchaeota archaeon]|nr:hypothetical protein [Candidatus Woesearchaeota archaeon]
MKNTIMILFLVLAMPFALAQEAANETVAAETKEYPTMQRAWDRVRLAFTWQEENKLALMEKMQQRREAHAAFLESKGKTEQANRFREGTSDLVQNMNQIRERREAKLGEMEQKRIHQGTEEQGTVMEQERQRLQDGSGENCVEDCPNNGTGPQEGTVKQAGKA